MRLLVHQRVPENKQKNLAKSSLEERNQRWREGTGYELGFRLNNKDDLPGACERCKRPGGSGSVFRLHRKVDSCWPPTAILGKARRFWDSKEGQDDAAAGL